MKIKHNIYHVIFFDIFFVTISLCIVSLGFFLGFELSQNNMAIYLIVNATIVFLGATVYIGYILSCKKYYELTKDSIKIVKNGILIEEIRYSQIRHCEYHCFYELFFGDSSGGKLVVYYNETGIQKRMEISCLKKTIRKIDYFKNL